MTDSFDLIRDSAFVGGEWVKAQSGEEFDVTNPADGSSLASLPDMGSDDTRAAIGAAEQAMAGWKSLSGKQRGILLRAWYELIIASQEELARLITLEQGKPLAEARGEVVYGAGFVEWFAEEARRTYGDVIPAAHSEQRYVVVRQPVGVVAAITPWNFPLAMVTRKCAPALAAGCTVVLKPAEATPLTALALAQLAAQAGIPAGVFNVLTCSSGERVGTELATNSAVRQLSFTGSTATGKLLLEQCAGTVKKVSMELGGNAPFIVFDDADIDAALAGAVASKYRNTGQTCICANRFFVHESVYAEFAERLTAAAGALTVANGLAEGCQQGPLISAAALEKVERLVGDAVGQGAVVGCGGQSHALGGTFYAPTVLTGVTPAMQIAGEEVFGPVAPLISFSTEAEVVSLANATSAGLAAYVYTEDMSRGWRVSEALEYGMVGLNETAISSEAAPFGGVKESGLGREGSRYGIDEYLEQKYICMHVAPA